MNKSIIASSVKTLCINFDSKIWSENKHLLLLFTFRVKLVSEVMLVATAETVLVWVEFCWYQIVLFCSVLFYISLNLSWEAFQNWTDKRGIQVL